jgi:glycosyltransferase involved in cell wall biosynthesis
MSQPTYSVIIPVYNRPQEVAELLESLTQQTLQTFEVILVEDGSDVTSEKIFEHYASTLSMQYIFKPNTGPGPSRNVGFEKARGKYVVVFDSDCILPSHYFEAVDKFLKEEGTDAWGGPDKGLSDFTALQQAMAFTMSSTLTTGGIRGGNKKAFQPRSFNMGMSREVYEKTNGFQFDRYAEDIELSVRIRKLGFKTSLIPEAFVFHKRRTSLYQFFKQVSNFGKGRILVGRKHRGEIKIVHWLPAFFLLGLLAIPFFLVLAPKLATFFILVYSLYALLVATECLITSQSFPVAVLSIPALFVQMTGYGFGFLKTLLADRNKE